MRSIIVVNGAGDWARTALLRLSLTHVCLEVRRGSEREPHDERAVALAVRVHDAWAERSRDPLPDARSHDRGRGSDRSRSAREAIAARRRRCTVGVAFHVDGRALRRWQGGK